MRPSRTPADELVRMGTLGCEFGRLRDDGEDAELVGVDLLLQVSALGDDRMISLRALARAAASALDMAGE